MTGITTTEACYNRYWLIDETAESYQPIIIVGKRNNAVLVFEEASLVMSGLPNA